MGINMGWTSPPEFDPATDSTESEWPTDITEAVKLVDSRDVVYGDPVETQVRIAQVFSGILGIEVQPSTVPLLMIGVKLVRATSSPDYSDHSDDIDGYLEIFRKVIGDDMIQARSVSDYLIQKARQ